MSEQAKKKETWQDHLGRRKKTPAEAHVQSVADPRKGYKNKKFEGYPAGENSIYVDGRFLRGVVSSAHFQSVLMPPAAPAFGTLGPLQIRQHGPERCLYLPYIMVNSLIAREDIYVEWIIYSDGHPVASGAHSPTYQPLKLYFPPNSNQTFYARWLNATIAPPVNLRLAVALPWIEYQEEEDDYIYGEGNNRRNPDIGNVEWPAFV